MSKRLLEASDRVIGLLNTVRAYHGESVALVMDFLCSTPSVKELQAAIKEELDDPMTLRPQSAEQLSIISVIRKRVADAELGEGHEHQDFETCAECDAAISARSWLQNNGWMNSIALLQEIDEAYARAAAPPHETELGDRQAILKLIERYEWEIDRGFWDVSQDGMRHILHDLKLRAALPVAESRQREIQSALEVGAITEEEAKQAVRVGESPAAAPAAPLPQDERKLIIETFRRHMFDGDFGRAMNELTWKRSVIPHLWQERRTEIASDP